MAASGTDAAEGDEGRWSARAIGWRVPSVLTTESGMPIGWLDLVPGTSTSVLSEPSLTESGEPGDLAEFGRAEVTRRPRPRWSLRRRSHDPDPGDLIEPVDLDLVALGAKDEDQVWTDVALAALVEPEASDGDPSMTGIDAFAFASPGSGGPWSLLAAEQREPRRDHFTEPASRGSESPELDLEEEFWT